MAPQVCPRRPGRVRHAGAAVICDFLVTHPGDCLPPLAYVVGNPSLPPTQNVAALWLQRGLELTEPESDKKIIDGQRLFSILHSSHKPHDDSLHKGECIHILFTRLFLLGQCCFCCACNLTPVLVIVGAAPGDKSKEAVLPEAGVRIELQLFLGHEEAPFVSLLGECKQVCHGVQRMPH